MKIKQILLIFIAFFISINLHAQLSTNEKPPSFELKAELFQYDSKLVQEMPKIDMKKLEEEDKEEEKHDLPPRFGFKHKVSLNTENSGHWYDLPSGERMWKLEISSPEALSINLLYNKFWLPEGGKYFIYSADKKEVIGAFTSNNNKGDRKELQGFATALVYGNKCVLEYYPPTDSKSEEAIISIEYVVQGYRYIYRKQDLKDADELQVGYGSSASCNININCSPEADNWQLEKEAVARIIIGGNRYCSGALINSTLNNNTPLFLTADHCLNGNDAINSPNNNYSVFYWHYESPNCQNSGDPRRYSTSGATILANNSISDFALLQLTENPANLQNLNFYYLGWDRSGNSGVGGVGIHHPVGDVKKISVDNESLTNIPYSISWSDGSISQPNTHWQTIIDKGTTQGGSSGSPILNNHRKVIGQLHGGPNSNCAPVLKQYGRFDVSWTGANNPDIRRRLDHWLDPNNTGTVVMDGRPLLRCDWTTINQVINNNTKIICNNVNINNTTIQNNAKVRIDAYQVIINPGFELKTGSELEFHLVK